MLYPFKVYPAKNSDAHFWAAESIVIPEKIGQGETINQAIAQLECFEREWIEKTVHDGIQMPPVSIKDLTPSQAICAKDGSQIMLYTDGCCLINPDGPGGWGFIIEIPGKTPIEKSGGCASTTNNRMEMAAVIEGLKLLPPGSKATVVSDSQYVIHTMTKGWKRGKNTDLWPILDKLTAERNITFEWIKGHAGHPQNERCDQLAYAAAKEYQI